MNRRPSPVLPAAAALVALALLAGCRTVTQGPQLTKIPADDAVLPISTLPDVSPFPDRRVSAGMVYQWAGEPYAVAALERYDARITRAEVEAARDREAEGWLRRYAPRDLVLPPLAAVAPLSDVTIDGRPGWSWYLGPGEGRPNARRLVAVIPWDENATWVIALDCPGDGMTREEIEAIVASFVVADRTGQDLAGALVLAALAAAIGAILWKAKKSRPRES